MEPESVKVLAAALALLPLIAVAMSLGRIFSTYYELVSRNPSAAEFMDKKFNIAFAMTEAIGIFALLVSLLILLG